jgi:AraC-like DNA-binding protein
LFEHSFSFLFFAAATQGLFLAFLLRSQTHNARANKILAVWIAVLSVDLLQQIYYGEDLYKSFPMWIGVINFLPLTYGGFLYLYVRTFIQPSPLAWRDLIHFASYILMVTLNLPLILQSGDKKLLLIEQMFAGHAPWTLQVSDGLSIIVATIYALISCRLVLHNPSVDSKGQLFWLRVMLGFNLLIWIVVWCVSVFPSSWSNHLIYSLVSLFIYTLGYFSLKQPDNDASNNSSPDIGGPLNNEKDSQQKYGDNRLPDDLRNQLLAVLENYMQEAEPWRASHLTLLQLSEATHIASHHISQVLNDHRGQSFNDYINGFRVQAVCDQLRVAPAHNLLDLALACGFSSKSAFNAAFKKYTGKTPSAYRKEVQS